MAAVKDDHGRPSLLSGLWALLVGALGIVILLLVLQPVTAVEDCPNYLSAGSASAFSNQLWDFYFPVVMLGWIVLVIMEQVLPITWRNRSRLNGTLRAVAAVLAAIVGSCWVAGGLLAICN